MASWLFYLLVVLAVLCLIALGFLAHAGFFSDLRIRTSIPVSCPKRVAYRLHKGPYSNAGSAYRQIGGLAPNQASIGVYYDDPKEVPAAELRYIIGCVLPEEKSQLEEKLKANGYSVWTFPTCSNAVITEFPMRSFLSCMIAPWIVYPALTKYFKKYDLKTAGPIIEVYADDVCRYITPLENNQGFFVPEVAQKDESKKEQ